jgi:diguanylate cyclase (GGDEF)-like protein
MSIEPPLAWRVLLVDDDRVLRAMLRRALEKEGYSVVEAADGEACLLLAQADPQPDLILLDALMPKLDGFDCCGRLLALPGGGQRPILMITGLEDQASVDRAFDAGATDFITKPVHWPVMRRRVRLLLEQRRLWLELEEANRKLQGLALTDSLTGVANRRRFDEQLTQEWLRASRDRAQLSLIMADLDSFKPYNDFYGHPAGDRCLRAVAEILVASACRPADVVARYGGEEFAVILPNTDLAGAIVVAERIRRWVEAAGMSHERAKQGNQVTISLGVATAFCDREALPVGLVERADAMLYQAKAAGGNGVRSVAAVLDFGLEKRLREEEQRGDNLAANLATKNV